MERSRFVTVALIIFSVLTVVNARHIIALSIGQLCLLVAIAIAVHLIAMACSTKSKLQTISPLISFAVLIIILLIVNAHGTFSKMIPTPGTIVNLIHDIREGIIAIRSDTIPLSFSIPIFLVAIVVTWMVAEIGETLAQRLHSSAPTLLWYIIISACIAAQGKSSNLTVVIFSMCAASWFFLYAFDKGHERSRSHVISIPRSTQVSNLTTYLIAFIVIGIISTLLVVPVKSLPSLAPNNIFQFLNNPSQQNELSPLVGMREQLTKKETQTLFTATSSEAQYFRTNVLTDFDGNNWTTSSKTQQEPEVAPSGVSVRTVDGSVELKALVAKFLPTYYSTQSLSTRDVDFLKSSVVYSRKESLTSYTFSASVPPDTLTTEQIAQSSQDYPKSIASNTLLPISFNNDNPIVKQAQEIASNRGSIYEQAIALRDFFLDESFTYDLSVDYSSSTDAMMQFLKDRRGFCEQFATTYAAFARSVGIPARVVVGFTPGNPDASGTFTITNQQAHAWAEVYLSNFGWLTIDPTPAGELPGQAPTNIGAAVVTTTTTAPAATVPPVTESTLVNPSTTVASTRVDTTTQQSRTPIAMYALLAILLACGIIALIIFLRKRRNSPHNDSVFVIKTFEDLGERVLNVPPQPDLTIGELVERVPDNEVILEFLALLTLASYAPDANISLHQLRNAAAKARAERIKS